MSVQGHVSIPRAARPFGSGLRDEDLRLVVASTDVRYRQKLRAVIVRRSTRGHEPFVPLSAELIVLNSRDNIRTLKAEAHMLDPDGRLQALAAGDLADVLLESKSTGERVMITSVSPEDFKRVEAVAPLEQIHIGGNDRGSWVCRLVDAERLDALFSGRVIDVRNTED